MSPIEDMRILVCGFSSKCHLDLITYVLANDDDHVKLPRKSHQCRFNWLCFKAAGHLSTNTRG